jgi:tRNA(Ile)-lysidine synthase
MAKVKKHTTFDRLLDSVTGAIRKYELLRSGDRVLVAVSGGADSMFLLWALHQIELDTSNPLGIELHVAHLNHCLRDDAWDDAEFVREQSDKLGIPCTIEEQDVKSYCQQAGLSLEQGARELRYRFLTRAATEFGMSKIATGHTASDQVETFFLRVGRGSGGRGLLLIPPKRTVRNKEENGIDVIRPLIEITGEEIRQFLDARRMPYCKDVSNDDLSNIRNHIRHEVIPRLKEVVPNLSDRVTRLREILSEEEEFLQTITEERIERLSDQGKEARDELVLDLKGFIDTPLPIKRRILRTMYARFSKRESLTPDYPGFDEVENAITYIENSRRGKAFDLANIRITSSCGKIRIAEKREPTCNNQQSPVELSVPGEVRVNGFRLRLRHRTGLSFAQMTDSKTRDTSRSREYFDAAGLELPLVVRRAQNGDRIRLKAKARVCEKKLKDVFIDDKIPVWERRSLPLLADSKGVLWIVGRRRAYRAMVEENTAKVIEACVE